MTFLYNTHIFKEICHNSLKEILIFHRKTKTFKKELNSLDIYKKDYGYKPIICNLSQLNDFWHTFHTLARLSLIRKKGKKINCNKVYKKLMKKRHIILKINFIMRIPILTVINKKYILTIHNIITLFYSHFYSL